MFYFSALVIAAAGALPSAFAHGGVLTYSIGSSWYPGFAPYNSPTGQSTIQRPWSSYNPITDPTSATLACNDDGTSGSSQLTASISAGSAITAYWNSDWEHPYGPMLTYLAQCPGSTCTGVNANSLKWFKIDQAGLLSGTVANGVWGAGKMVSNNASWTSTIPASVPSGNYLIRFETIALHSLPAQMYPECAQLDIVNGGTRAPTAAELVSFPGAYSASDPGLTTNLYTTAAQTQTTYQIPGPPLYGSSGGSTPASSSTGATTAAPATSTHASTTAAPATSTVVVGGLAQYAQCGGIGYSGASVCASPYTCKVTNEYYSQCL